ncbi:MAG: phage integrase SAM-like domain-containing protein [Bacteroidales bacterium]|nr:phage integrase SAM-like domain-containing protein [Bacteroidales bacterium]
MVLNFVCRASKARKDGQSPIELSVIINQQRSIITLDRKINHKHFNPSTQKVKGDKAINEYLDTIRKKCYSIENELIKQDNLTLKTFIDVYKYGFQSTQITLLPLYDKLIKTTLTGTVEDNTIYKYRKAKERMTEYLKTIDKTDIDVNSITPSFCNQFHSYCSNSLKPSTVQKEMKMFKRILQFAVNEGVIKVNPFNIKLKAPKLVYEPLSINELQKIWNMDVEGSLEKVRDCFIFQCYTGLSYCDMASLSMDDIKDGIIYKNRKKTDVRSVIPLLPIPRQILEKYNYNLPVISNQKYNVYLKALATACGIKTRLYSHLARHTAATVMINNGIELPLIARMLGHSNTKITETIYATLKDETIRTNTDRIKKAFSC